jgi:hypothetical protein
MTSSIGEAKKFISDAAEQAVVAQKACDSATSAVEEAVELLKKAAEDSGNEHIQSAFKTYAKAMEAIADAKKQVNDAQEAAENYSETLG